MHWLFNGSPGWPGNNVLASEGKETERGGGKKCQTQIEEGKPPGPQETSKIDGRGVEGFPATLHFHS